MPNNKKQQNPIEVEGNPISKNLSEGSCSNDEFEVEELLDDEEIDYQILEHKTTFTNTQTDYLNANDLKSKLRRWAINSEIPASKLNSLLRIIKDYHNDFPYNAKSLLGAENYKKQKFCRKNFTHQEGLKRFKRDNDDLTSIQDQFKTQVEDVLKNLNNTIDTNISHVENLMKLSFENKTETNHMEGDNNPKDNRPINFPLETFAELDSIHKLINDLEFRNKLISELKCLKDEYGFDGAFRKTMTDEFLKNYILKNYANQKGFINFDFYSKVLFEAWKDPGMGMKAFTIQFSKSFKKSTDRQYLKLKSQKERQSRKLANLKDESTD